MSCGVSPITTTSAAAEIRPRRPRERPGAPRDLRARLDALRERPRQRNSRPARSGAASRRRRAPCCRSGASTARPADRGAATAAPPRRCRAPAPGAAAAPRRALASYRATRRSTASGSRLRSPQSDELRRASRGRGSLQQPGADLMIGQPVGADRRERRRPGHLGQGALPRDHAGAAGGQQRPVDVPEDRAGGMGTAPLQAEDADRSVEALQGVAGVDDRAGTPRRCAGSRTPCGR